MEQHFLDQKQLAAIEQQLDKASESGDAACFVRLSFSDVHGIARGVTIPAANVKYFLNHGYSAFAGTVLFGFGCDISKDTFLAILEKAGVENCLFFPAEPRLFSLGWLTKPEHQTYEVICEARWADGSVYEVMPRYQARKQLELLQSEFGYTLKSAFECEFLSLNEATLKPGWSTKEYCSHEVMNQSIDWLYQLDKHLRHNDVDLRTIHSEYSEGQFEVTMMPAKGLKTADDLYLFKQAIKAIAKQHDKVVTFMTRMLKEGSSNGQHFNHSLWNEAGESVLWDSAQPHNLSDVGRHWLGGLLEHMAAITALCCPTINCYRRLHQVMTPTRPNWNIDDRMTSLRLVNTSPASTRVEHRLPSSACNPYLVLAGVVAAGLDGLRRKLQPPPPGKNEDAASLPHSLDEALTALEADDVIRAALGEQFMKMFVQLKRDTEVKRFKGHDMKKFIEDELKAERDYYLMSS